MGKPVLTLDAKVSCDHPPVIGGGAVTLTAGQDVLKAGGGFVLIKSLAGAAIGTGCVQTTAPAVACATVLSQLPGSTSTVLRVGGQPVLLHTTSGQTAEGKPDNNWSSKDAGQDNLKAD